MLSSDPNGYPLEAGIAPLVFEFNRLGVFDPCWSCEGHIGTDGDLWKVPRVWFYAESVVHVRVLAECLQDLSIAGRLNGTWQVVVTYSDSDNADTAFSLEPVVKDPIPSLGALQRDVATIAEELHRGFLARARKLSTEID
ncbi:MAG: hypothetical protein QNJ94_10900 [Alphaproteobacteria bacterium]|nr:hypothetical protein [Alphaproteobacteria bacterium]